MSALLVVILALGLGLGLGLGLRNHSHSASPPQNVSSSGTGTTNSSNLLPLLATPPNNFVLGTIKGQPPQTRFYNFTISKVQGAPDGVSKPMLVANGIFPGPTIEANQGDRIVVNVTNNLDTRTAIHWHGLYQNQTNFYDGTTGITECGIPPGQFLVYNFTLGEFYGTTWWHSHFSTQYTDGLTGALVIHPLDPAPKNIPTWDGEIMVQMADVYHNFSQELLDAYLSPSGIDGNPGDEPVPDSGSLNGLGQWGGGGDYFNFTLEDNKTYRIRLVNSGSFAPIRFSIDYHPLTIIEVDGTFVKPYVVTGLTIAVAQRYSVLIHTNQTEGDGRYWMRTLLQSDMFTYDQPGQNVDIRGVLKYASGVKNESLPSAGADPGVPSRKDIGDMDTASLVPAVVSRPPNPTRPYYVSFDLQNDANGRFLAFMSGTSWSPLSGNTTLLNVRNAFIASTTYASTGGSVQPGDQFMITEDSIEVVDLIIDNLDDGDHPFHLHGHRPWIMGTGAGRYQGQALNSTNPLRRDTMVIPAYSYMVLRFITDNPGLWAFHCHLVWHMAAGLLMQINSLPTKAGQLDIPQVIIDQCNASVPGE
ncbi:multicopper oxidase 2A [Irpex rosettiformis]|uniref:Multicopper oxidase 2A n=1 Tax=Irpex rosettiformis TaxID=378272 RepID=A0ACB8UD10_9APHY|nr:multicopper oxidase 2A [Irpex rosettiformis]